jgi:hypothetical protein
MSHWLHPKTTSERAILALAGIALAVAIFAKSAAAHSAEGDDASENVRKRQQKRALIARTLRKLMARGSRLHQAVDLALESAARAGHVIGETDEEWALRLAQQFR